MPYLGSTPAATILTADDIADGAVTTAKINDDAITSAKINDDAITSAKIADDNVTLAKLAGGTDGNIISFDASGDPVAIATGSSGQALTSGGAGAAPAFADAGGGFEFVEKVTASTSATVDLGDDSNVVAGYDYIILFDAADFSADQAAATFIMQFGTGSTPTYQTSTVYATQGQYISTTTEDTSARLTSQAGINIGSTTNINIGGAGANETVTGEIYIFSPASNRKTRCMMKMMFEDNSANGPVASWGYGERAADDVVTSFRIKPSSGNVTSGDFILCRRKIA